MLLKKLVERWMDESILRLYDNARHMADDRFVEINVKGTTRGRPRK